MKSWFLPIIKKYAVLVLVVAVLACAFGAFVRHANRPVVSAPVTIDNTLVVTPQAGPSPTATPSPSPTPFMSADQARRYKEAGATNFGAHAMSADNKLK